jgi:hypothetical protein
MVNNNRTFYLIIKTNFMKKLITLLIPLFILTSCFEENKTKNEAKTIKVCFDIIETSSNPQKILINKCTGESWYILSETYPKEEKSQKVPPRTYKWHKINRMLNGKDGGQSNVASKEDLLNDPLGIR